MGVMFAVAVLAASLLSSAVFIVAAPLPICCPSSPATLCDFYFDGYQNKIPTFHLQDGEKGDHAISPASVASLRWVGSVANFSPGIKTQQIDKLVNIGGTGYNGTFLRCPKPVPEGENTLGQFYIAGDESATAKLYARSWQRQTADQNGVKWYLNRCIRLDILGATIYNLDGSVFNLDIADGNLDFPEDRRCIVFKTGP
eukprot:jgi/Mesen1/6560/ME000334S05891